ncbi:MAG TPA: HAMP domain-containing sensor histidine kinase, partial [Cyclobacteriaceae bacterium]|nr:HAMP domain-containing sensor histidine kinase [Cyclobacteriaceae bacterium]
KSTSQIYCGSYILFLLFFMLEIGHIYFGWSYFLIVRFLDIGFLCEATGLSIALSVQAGNDQEKLEEAKNKAQEENLLLISKQNQILEVRVNQRTFELVEKTKIAEQLSNEYKLQSEELREVNIVKDRLFSIISHDLRSPLRQLHGILNLADKSQLSEAEIKELLCQVRTNLGVNIHMIDNLLFWARSQMSGAKVNCQDFVLFNIVETKFQFFKQSFDAKKLLTSNRIHHNLKINSDENIIALLIHNLLANAIKFCESGDTIIVGSELRESEVVIYVSDTGVGMTSEDVQNILGNNTFTRHGTANEKGMGLGLKICKDLIHQLSGKLWLESKLGEGTTFYFSIPDKSQLQVVGNHGSLQKSA